MAEPGTLIGPYRLVAPLGHGAMGEVWRAKDERLDRYVALKVLPPDLAGDTERRARILREARAAAAVRHAHVVTLFDIVEHNGEDILVMELVEGRTLAEMLRSDGPAELERTLRWLEDITDALATAHARGILHRDIKAANVMISSDGLVKVLDFGLAKMLHADAAERGPADSLSRLQAARRRLSANAVAMDATMPSQPGGHGSAESVAAGQDAVPQPLAEISSAQQSASRRADLAAYETDAGSLLGTPMYMSPEQVAGGLPTQCSEVFSVGILAYEMIAGKPPYSATRVDELFLQIAELPPPVIAGAPAAVMGVLQRALAKQPNGRYPTMRQLRDAVIAVRRQLYTPRQRRWPLMVALGALMLVLGTAGLWWWTQRPVAMRPGDAYVQQALEEYDVFFADKALSSLRAALTAAPQHPRALAYMLLFGGAPNLDRDAALATAEAIAATVPSQTKDRTLLDGAIALHRRGPGAASEALTATRAIPDRELKFWAAEMQMRSGDYAGAQTAYAELLTSAASQFRGRIYDHYSAVLLYFDKPQQAVRIGKLYRDAFPGEADAVGVYATTLAVAGQFAEAALAADEARRLNEGEDTLAGLGKVYALQGDLVRARDLYRKSMARARDARRPIRRAALALLQWMDGDAAGAAVTVAPCLPGGEDSGIRQRAACLFVAGLINRSDAEVMAQQLEALAHEATIAQPAYGDPRVLADLLRAYATFTGFGCLLAKPQVPVTPVALDAATRATLRRVYQAPFDFYVGYHVPLLSTWQACEAAALDAATGDQPAAIQRLTELTARAPGRYWVERMLQP
ncbi:MAG: serine/threonine protein kinase [Kofleriaceae bacterium]|nr:serine/threonine protein kinase [Kofleriaceae bacterium]